MSGDSGAVLCIGEMLWDCLPRGLFLGGAPLNVAAHLHQLGREVLPVSAVGRDFLGDEILRRINEWDIDTRFVQQLADKPTGVVQVELTDGQPSYTIVEDVAWDAIPASDALRDAAASAAAMVFGTLGARTTANRRLIGELLEACTGLSVFDVNFRPPFDDHELVWEWAPHSSILKLNDHELTELLDDAGGSEDLADRCRRLRDRGRCERVLLTAGATGAGMLSGDDWHWVDGEPVEVADAVGAGDSFAAAVIDGLLAGAEPLKVLRRAARLAEFVASSDGATPDHGDAPEAARQLA